ncbi:MAG: hypothetical protein QXU18_00315 [Thermoplasmatales archaeon]
MEKEEEYKICPVCGERVTEFVAKGTCAFKVMVDTNGGSLKYDADYDDCQVDLYECGICGNDVPREFILGRK